MGNDGEGKKGKGREGKSLRYPNFQTRLTPLTRLTVNCAAVRRPWYISTSYWELKENIYTTHWKNEICISQPKKSNCLWTARWLLRCQRGRWNAIICLSGELIIGKFAHVSAYHISFSFQISFDKNVHLLLSVSMRDVIRTSVRNSMETDGDSIQFQRLFWSQNMPQSCT